MAIGKRHREREVRANRRDCQADLQNVAGARHANILALEARCQIERTATGSYRRQHSNGARDGCFRRGARVSREEPQVRGHAEAREADRERHGRDVGEGLRGVAQVQARLGARIRRASVFAVLVLADRSEAEVATEANRDEPNASDDGSFTITLRNANLMMSSG